MVKSRFPSKVTILYLEPISIYPDFKIFKARLHDRKIGYGPIKKGVRTSHFRSFKLCVSCFLGWVRTRVFSGFGAIDVYGTETRTNTGPYQFVHS